MGADVGADVDDDVGDDVGDDVDVGFILIKIVNTIAATMQNIPKNPKIHTQNDVLVDLRILF